MAEVFHVRLDKPEFVFSAAHFITYGGNVCERLHGHNYHVAVEVHGPLDDNQYVVDFIALRDLVRSLLAELDHRVLLPAAHPLIRVEIAAQEVTARFEDRRWVFPREDCVVLPVENTTAELLARYLGRRVLESADCLGMRPSRLKLEVDECDGQRGIWDSGETTQP